MKRFTQFMLAILLGISLFNNVNAETREHSYHSQIMNEEQLKKANDLFLKGSQTINHDLIAQVIDEYSLWLDANKGKIDDKQFAQALRSRANAFIALGKQPDAIRDFQVSILYDPIAEVQFGLCFLQQEQMASKELSNCYHKTVQLFFAKKTDKKISLI